MIEVKELYKKYTGNTYYSVENVSFDVKDNTICGLLGHNGAGKSTTMKMLSTLYTPDKGSIKIAGYDVTKKKTEVKKIVGVLFETARLYEQLTGEENILYYASLFGIHKSTAKQRIAEMYDDLEIDFQDRIVNTYSKGMKQKISMIRTLVTDPKVILMDEPTSGLDITSRSLIREYIFKLKEKGKTLLVTSHIAEDIEVLCDKVIIMKKGAICEENTIDNLKEKYNAKSFEEVYVRAT